MKSIYSIMSQNYKGNLLFVFYLSFWFCRLILTFFHSTWSIFVYFVIELNEQIFACGYQVFSLKLSYCLINLSNVCFKRSFTLVKYLCCEEGNTRVLHFSKHSFTYMCSFFFIELHLQTGTVEPRSKDHHRPPWITDDRYLAIWSSKG